jgi:ribokinase
MNGADPLEAVRFGVAAASLSVTRAGAIPSLPTLAEVEEFRRERG